jgi:Fe2+ or Zn2+ uptake regulation protein
MVLALIHSFKEKDCYMSNEGIASELNTSSPTVQRALKDLLNDGLVVREPSTKYKTGRILRSHLPVDNSLTHPHQNDEHPHQFDEAPHHAIPSTLINLMNHPHQFDEQHINLHIQDTYKLEREDTASPLPLSEPSVAKPKNTQKPKISLENYGFNVDERQAVERWVEFRRQTRKPLTQISLDAQVKKFGKDLPLVIEQSIENGWQGLFALKAGNRSNPQDKAIQAYTKLSAAANRQDKAELNRLCEADPRIVQAIAAQGIKPKTWLLKHLQLDNDFVRKAEREAFVAAYNSVAEGN